jgi:hypothetical protein
MLSVVRQSEGIFFLFSFFLCSNPEVKGHRLNSLSGIEKKRTRAFDV